MLTGLTRPLSCLLPVVGYRWDRNFNLPEHIGLFIHALCLTVHKRSNSAAKLNDTGVAIDGSRIIPLRCFPLTALFVVM